MRIIYAPIFIRQFKRLEQSLKEEILEKIKLFGNPANHQRLRVHKLHGFLQGCYGFSVNYRVRIVFEYLSKSEVAILSVGDHDVYR